MGRVPRHEQEPEVHGHGPTMGRVSNVLSPTGSFTSPPASCMKGSRNFGRTRDSCRRRGKAWGSGTTSCQGWTG